MFKILKMSEREVTTTIGRKVCKKKIQKLISQDLSPGWKFQQFPGWKFSNISPSAMMSTLLFHMTTKGQSSSN